MSNTSPISVESAITISYLLRVIRGSNRQSSFKDSMAVKLAHKDPLRGEEATLLTRFLTRELSGAPKSSMRWLNAYDELAAKIEKLNAELTERYYNNQ